MPCRSDYMEPTAAEKHRRDAAKLAVYLDGATGVQTPPAVERTLDNAYPTSDVAVEYLCRRLRSLSEDEVNTVVYNGRSADARRLADWYEAHKVEDQKREAIEARRVERMNLSRSIIAKLSPAELHFVGGLAYLDERVNDTR